MASIQTLGSVYLQLVAFVKSLKLAASLRLLPLAFLPSEGRKVPRPRRPKVCMTLCSPKVALY